ncbi:MAG: diguanylate cyclase [Gammaproteobacteria bacterium]|nr:diguanylate cyclase [Gammaproteobacteria bacterium]
MKSLEPSLSTTALELLPSGVIITDTDNRIFWINKTMQGFLSVDGDRLIGQEFSSIEADFLIPSSNTRHVWRIPQPLQDSERWLIQVQQELSPGFTAHYFSDSSELVQLKAANKSLSDQLDNTSTSDPITGVLNRRALLQGLEPQVSRSRRYGNPLALIVLEIEKFASSDRTVSAVTEHVLKGVGYYLRDQLRWVDLVGRTNTREFTLVLPETGLDDAQSIARKILARLQQLSLPDTPNLTVKVDAKIGIVEWEKGDDINRLIEKAQDAADGRVATA